MVEVFSGVFTNSNKFGAKNIREINWQVGRYYINLNNTESCPPKFCRLSRIEAAFMATDTLL